MYRPKRIFTEKSTKINRLLDKLHEADIQHQVLQLQAMDRGLVMISILVEFLDAEDRDMADSLLEGLS